MSKRKGRTLAIGDIHGCLGALKTLEKSVGFRSADTIIALGDYIDRGSDSKGVLDWMIEKKDKYNLINLLGNHEEMILDSRECVESYSFWLMNGGDHTLNSFDSSITKIPKKYWDFMENCHLYYETNTHIFVHAGLEPHLPPEEQETETLCWLRFRDLEPHISKKMVICGHTPQRGNLPGVLPHGICIDTYAFSSTGYLTCLDVDTGEYWQTNNAGETKNQVIIMPRKVTC